MEQSNNANKIVYVKSDSSSGSAQVSSFRENISVNGVLKLQRPYCQASFAERIRVGINIRANPKPRSIQDWNSIINRKSPLTGNSKSFQIDQSYWFGSGINFVIPTPVFDETLVKISLNPSALLSTGFTVEVFNRDSTIVHEVRPDAKYSAGAEISFRIKWNINSNTAAATPIIVASEWNRRLPHQFTVNDDQPSTSGLQRHQTRGQPFKNKPGNRIRTPNNIDKLFV